jgi:hypothetical protein
MLTRPLAIALVFVAASAAAPAKRPGTPKAIDFCPLRVGNTWEFEMELGNATSAFTTHMVKVDKVDGQQLFESVREIDGRASGGGQILSANENGLFRHRTNGQDVMPPLCMVKYPFKPGEKWTSRVKIGDRETEISASAGEPTEVEVPAGKFTAYPVTMIEEQNGATQQTTYWYAADVGCVLQTGTRDGKPWYTYRLKKFTPAAKDDK